jgi:hypothetical protein
MLIAKLQSRGITMSVFQEPDLDNQITAIAIEPSKEAHKACSSLPLALSERNSRRENVGALISAGG